MNQPHLVTEAVVTSDHTAPGEIALSPPARPEGALGTSLQSPGKEQALGTAAPCVSSTPHVSPHPSPTCTGNVPASAHVGGGGRAFYFRSICTALIFIWNIHYFH